MSDDLHTDEAPKHGVRYLDENQLHPRRDRSLAPEFPNFDWQALYVLCDGAKELAEPDREKLCQALREVFRFVVLEAGSMTTIAQRAVALSWTVNPALWDGKSAAEVARYLGCPVQRLHVATGAARRRFGIHNPSQDHAGNFKA
jgi:hypothetical protein